MIKVDEKLQRKVIGYINNAKESTNLSEQRERARLYQDFFRGNQWTEEDYNYYKKTGVEPVTLNRCRPIIKSVVGMYLRNRNSIRVMPVRSGTKAVAQVLTELIKHTEDISNADYVYRNCFLSGVIDSESYLCIDINESENDNGQIEITDKSIFDVDIDPSCESYDVNKPMEGAKYAIIRSYIDKEHMYLMHKEILEKQGVTLEDGTGFEYNEALAAYMCDDDIFDDYSDELKQRYRFCVKSVWWREPVEGILVKDKESKKSRVFAKSNHNYKKFKTTKLKRFETKPHTAYILHKTTVINNIILNDVTNPFGEDTTDLPLFRYSPYWHDGKPAGHLDDIISLNKEENIHRTQTIKILNSVADSGWIVGRVQDEPTRNLLSNYGSVNGLVLEREKLGGYVEKIKPNDLPTGIFALGQQFNQDSKAISGIDDATMGIDTGKSESGRAISLRQQQNQTATELAFDNMYYTLELTGKFLVDIIRLMDVYTDEEILSVITESPLLDKDIVNKAKYELEAELGGGLAEPQMPPPFTPEMLANVKPEDKPNVIQTVQQGMQAANEYAKAYPMMAKNYESMLKDIAAKTLIEQLRGDKLGQYGVRVAISPTAPTEQMLRFMEIDSIASKYPGIIPPDILIDATNLSNKDEIKDRILQQQQAMMAQAQMQQQQASQPTARPME